MAAICITMLICTVILGGFMIAAVDKLLSKKQGAQKPTIEMKSAEESLGIDSETYNKIVDECIYGDDKQNPTWREEDEHRINRLIAYFEDKESFTAEDDIVYANWLKSIKDRYIWKPSDEQMHYLSWIANIELGDSVVEQEVSKHLNELYKDLKKLREE